MINGTTLSDDSFLYFRSWLVAQGQRVFEAALEDPDSLASTPEVEPLAAWDESVRFAASKAFEQLTGQSIYDYVREFDGDAEAEYFDWQQYTPEVLAQRFPRSGKSMDIDIVASATQVRG